MPLERRLLRTRPLGSWLLGPGDEGDDRLWLRVQILLAGSQIVANLVGTILVTLLLALVIPGRPVLTTELAWINFVAVPAYVLVSLVVGWIVGAALTRRALRCRRMRRDLGSAKCGEEGLARADSFAPSPAFQP